MYAYPRNGLKRLVFPAFYVFQRFAPDCFLLMNRPDDSPSLYLSYADDRAIQGIIKSFRDS